MPSELPIPSVSSPAFREWFSNKAPESVRKPFIQRVDKSDLKNLEGVPDVGEIRFSLTVPELVNALHLVLVIVLLLLILKKDYYPLHILLMIQCLRKNPVLLQKRTEIIFHLVLQLEILLYLD